MNNKINNLLNGIQTQEIGLQDLPPTTSTGVTIQLPRFHDEMKDLWNCQWYWGGITYKRANRLLYERPIGTFLVRDSHSENSVFTLSYKAQYKIYHTRISRHRGYYCLGGPNALIKSTSIIDIIEQTINSSNNSKNQYSILMQPTEIDPTTRFVELKHPLGRNQFLNPLKYWCRMAIRSRILDVSHIETLNLPQHLKEYLADACYADIIP